MDPLNSLFDDRHEIFDARVGQGFDDESGFPRIADLDHIAQLGQELAQPRGLEDVKDGVNGRRVLGTRRETRESVRKIPVAIVEAYSGKDSQAESAPVCQDSLRGL